MVAITPVLYIFEALSVSNPSGVQPEFWKWVWKSMWEDLSDRDRRSVEPKTPGADPATAPRSSRSPSRRH
jgi:hypothetical protein